MRITELPLVVQTGYAELIDQLRIAKTSEFPVGTTFRKRNISGKDYWYAQRPTTLATGRPSEQYLGADTALLRQAITAAKQFKADVDQRKTIIRTLHTAGLPKTDPISFRLLDALALAGVFRLRGVLVGTLAFQAYSGILGVRLPSTAIQTGDMDIAQDYGISLALDDVLETPLLDILQEVDPTFQPIPDITKPTASTSYVGANHYRVDILTTNRGAAQTEPVKLPALKTDALPLRHLDYLLRDTYEAALLSRHGVLVNVPAPERFAIHKLILSVMRQHSRGNVAKSNKDTQQAGVLIEALLMKHRHLDLKEAYQEACDRGPAWQRKLTAGIQRLPQQQQDLLSLL